MWDCFTHCPVQVNIPFFLTYKHINDIKNSCKYKYWLHFTSTGVPLSKSLHFSSQLATSKGLISGDLCYLEENGTMVDCSSSTTVSLDQKLSSFCNVHIMSMIYVISCPKSLICNSTNNIFRQSHEPYSNAVLPLENISLRQHSTQLFCLVGVWCFYKDEFLSIFVVKQFEMFEFCPQAVPVSSNVSGIKRILWV